MEAPPVDKRDPESYAILGAAMEVHGILRDGFMEAVYQAALAAEFDLRGIPHLREAHLPIHYKGQALPVHYRADFVCYDRIIVELKAIPRLGNLEQAQAINYMRATGRNVALLLNFGAPRLEYKRMIL